MDKRLFLIAVALILCSRAGAELAPEKGEVQKLAAPRPHWVWVNDIFFLAMEAGKAYLVDADDGRVLGMLSTGFGHVALALPRAAPVIYAAEIYFSRGTRGERNDVVTVYDARTLAPVDEIDIPDKRTTSMPTLWHVTLTDDDRFVLIYNFTPAQSVTVVDTRARKLAGEIETPGCTLVYPSGPRRFHMVCGDGSLLTVTLDDGGREQSKTRSAPFFKPDGDFITEKAVRHGERLLFFSVQGDVVPIDVSGPTPRFERRWPLFDEEDRADGWRIGGVQHSAVHDASGRLYVLVHKGGEDTHKDPGEQVWVYDLARRERVQQIRLEKIASSIQVTQDEAPLLLATFIGIPELLVYDARSGEHLRTVPEVGLTPTVLQTPVGP